MRLKRHKIEGIPFNAAKWIGATITPELLVIHDTASRLQTGNAARYLRDNPAKVSVQFILERDGSLEQQVPTNRRANHAGRIRISWPQILQQFQHRH
jgi:N-acetylmuramoyl-L-alanine amidase